MEWRCAGLGWPGGVPVLRWAGGRSSALTYGRVIGFRAGGERRCVGARGNPCPLRAVVPARATQARCPECARLDRAFSVAADGVPDDPRTYRVYLAWFGAGLVKVGITAEERGAVRLLEQGAVAFCWLGRGPLMAGAAYEELLRAALGVPDRVPYARKRAVRGALPGWAERARELAELYRRAVVLEGGPRRWSGWSSRRTTTRRRSGGARRRVGWLSGPLTGVLPGPLMGSCGSWSTAVSWRGGSSPRPGPICTWRSRTGGCWSWTRGSWWGGSWSGSTRGRRRAAG